MGFFGGQSKEEKARSKAIQDSGNTITGIGEGQTSKGNQIFKMFKKSGKAAGDFYRGILSGDRTALNEILGPELSRIGDQAKSAREGLLLSSPRGGARASGFTDIGNKEMELKGDAILSARPTAAAGLSNLLPTFSNFSSNLSGQGLAGYNAGVDINFKLNEEMERIRQRQAQLFGELGGLAGSVIGSLAFPAGGGGGRGGIGGKLPPKIMTS